MIAESIDPIAEIARVICSTDIQKAKEAIALLNMESITMDNKDDGLTVLHFCLLQEDEKSLSVFRFLITKGLSVRDCDKEERSALQIAVAAKNPIAALIRITKVDPTAGQEILPLVYGDGDEKSILYQSLKEGDWGALVFFISISVDFSQKNADGVTLLGLLEEKNPGSLQTLLYLSLNSCARKSNLMESLIKSGACPLKLNEKGLSVAHVAAMHYDPEGLKALLRTAPEKSAAMLTVKTQEEGDTPLHCAAKKNSHEVLRYLLGLFGANTSLNELTNAAGRNALHEVVIHNAREATQCLFAMPCFHENILIKVPPAYPSRKEEGWSVAHCAAFYGSDRVLPLLVKAGVNFSGLSALGDSALMVAIGARNFSLVPSLLEVAPEMADTPNKAGVRPIRLLVKSIILNYGLSESGHKEGHAALRLLLNKITLKDHNDAAFCAQWAISDPLLLKILLEAGLSPNTQLNKTPVLHVAADAGYRASALLLCEFGADLDAKNPDGQKACDVASISLIVEDLLKKMRAVAALQDSKGANPASEPFEWRGFVSGFQRQAVTTAVTLCGSSPRTKIPVRKKPSLG